MSDTVEETSEVWAMRIDRLKDGGFMVGPIFGNGNMVLFACTEINDALAYIDRTLFPPRPVESDDVINAKPVNVPFRVKRP